MSSNNHLQIGPPVGLHRDLIFLWDQVVDDFFESFAHERMNDPEFQTENLTVADFREMARSYILNRPEKKSPTDQPKNRYGILVNALKGLARKYATIFDVYMVKHETQFKHGKRYGTVYKYLYQGMENEVIKSSVDKIQRIDLALDHLARLVSSDWHLEEFKSTAQSFVEQFRESALVMAIRDVFGYPMHLVSIRYPSNLVTFWDEISGDYQELENISPEVMWPGDSFGAKHTSTAFSLLQQLMKKFSPLLREAIEGDSYSVPKGKKVEVSPDEDTVLPEPGTADLIE